HEMTGTAISKEIPGLHEVHAVDAAGVHPLLLAIGSERYTPYYKEKRPQEILTIANHILGTGQLSLAKFLFICDKNDNETLSTHDEEKYFHHILERIDLSRDIHFQTKTSIDTLDYSGDGLNTGSKVIIAACGDKKRDLLDKLPTDFSMPSAFKNRRMVTNGILALEMSNAQWSMLNSNDIADLNKMWSLHKAYFEKIPLLIICDDADFVTANFSNFLWVTFTRSNPSNDIYGINERFENKHWCCDTLIIDARIKSHHAPVLEKNAAAEKRVDEILSNGKF
ncbi:MAG TPA: UbiD family decarboxylase, partial [Chitinophagales bacterium]|nr:UbiD family decarboxylase [Chitinophagales bacterium]